WPWRLGWSVLRSFERSRVARGSARGWWRCRQAKQRPYVRERGGRCRQENGEDVREHVPVEGRDVAKALPRSAWAGLLGQQTLVHCPHGHAHHCISPG